jgi:hypothetical protein
MVVVSYSNRTDENGTILCLFYVCLIVSGDRITSHIRHFVMFYCDILYRIEVKMSDCYKVEILSNKLEKILY